ncbi:MAG: S8 family peptidase [Steroidobacteraceae bacterium]
MKQWASIIILAALTCACSNTPVRIESSALSKPSSQPADRLIIAAVNNDPVAFMTRAGSTPRGYNAITPYGPTSSAIKSLRSLEADYDLREVNAWSIEPLHMHCAVLELAVGVDRMSLLATLSADPRVKLAQPMQTFSTRTQAYNDPYVELQRGLEQMGVVAAQAWSLGGGVKVAIIDTGVDTEHPDLRGRIVEADNFVDSDAEQFRSDRHGTEMAGVIAAVANNREGIVGVAPEARLLVLKACWQLQVDADAARCNSFTLARALVAAFDAHAQVINLSLAGPDDPLLRELIREGLRRGVLFVGAAHFDGINGDMGFLHQPGVIEVASAETHAPAGSALYAPGREILTLLPGGHYDFATGDSIATAQVTGVVALLLERNPKLSAAVAYKLLRDTSAHAVGDTGRDEHVDACAAMIALMGRGSCK